ncbi:MAG: extracellular solute-binding protein, partial [Chloroflexi bacterium]|nr:extracellular solute-binding protein [Chloroflexota bacterium]
AGLVHDLTDYIATDLAFDQVDFYKQIWQGVRWQERIWWMPQAANMRMLFYDKDAYALAGYPEPSLGWTWADMSQDIAALIPAQPEGRHDLSWGYMDVGLDTLFSYAFNWDSRCAETSDIACQYQLQTQNVAAAFEWYNSMVGQPGLIPDFTELIPFEANILLMNFQGARRQAVIWVDGAVNYEHQLLLANTGIVPFPGSDKYGGISPLWVYGNF